MNNQPFEVLCNTGDEESWLRKRNGGIGASEIAIVLGVSKWASVLELYARKIGEDTPEHEDHELMLWGRLLEPAIRDELARRAGVTLLEAPPRLLRSKEIEWAIATPDALTVNWIPVEVKNLCHGYDEAEWAQGIPEQYYLQCHHQMLVTGAPRCLFGALLWGGRLVWEWVDRDEMTIRKIVHAGNKFWFEHVVPQTPPPSDGHPNARKVLALQATDEEPVELFEAECGNLFERYEAAKAAHEAAAAAEKKAKRQLEATKDDIAQELGGHRAGFTATGWRMHWKTSERRGYTVEPTAVHSFKIEKEKLKHHG